MREQKEETQRFLCVLSLNAMLPNFHPVLSSADFVDIFTERTLVGWNLALDGCRLHFSLKTPLATTKAIRTTSAAHVVGPVKRKIRTNLQKDKLGVWSFGSHYSPVLRFN
ncbi:unnamed protein product [Tenebrio molitor]|nr:unnamed protein product [Tenebrio molitor]